MTTLDRVGQQLRQFAQERDWEQFHTPKNLSMALAGEAGELLEVFQWLTPEQSINLEEPQRRAAAEEIADVLIYALRLCDVLGLDALEEIGRKIEDNASRYPAETVRGSAAKH